MPATTHHLRCWGDAEGNDCILRSCAQLICQSHLILTLDSGPGVLYSVLGLRHFFMMPPSLVTSSTLAQEMRATWASSVACGGTSGDLPCAPKPSAGRDRQRASSRCCQLDSCAATCPAQQYWGQAAGSKVGCRLVQAAEQGLSQPAQPHELNNNRHCSSSTTKLCSRSAERPSSSAHTLA